jgi:purine-binding chemotaxis protein CheW
VPRKKKNTEQEAVPEAPDAQPDATSDADIVGLDTPAPVAEVPAVTREIGRILTFRLDDQYFGLPIENVQEIQQIVELMPLPDAPPALVGLLDVRGTVVPAIDLRILVGMERRDYRLETPMVFCNVHGRVVCLIVDAVEDVVEVPPDTLQAPSKLYSLAEKMIGVCRLPHGLVMIFDPERLVPDSALLAAEGAGGDQL